MNRAQKIIKNSISLFTGDIVSNLLGFVSIIYLVRILGPENFGKISFCMAFVAYFALIVNFGLPLLGTQEISRNNEKIRYYLNNILSLRLLLASLSFALLFLTAIFLNKPYEIKYLLILYGLGLFPFALLLEWLFQGIEKMEYIGVGRILSALTYLALVFWFIKGPSQLFLVACFQVATSFLAALFLIYIYLKNHGYPGFGFELAACKGLIKQAFPVFVAIGLTQVYQGTDIVLLGFMRGNTEVGYYNAAYKIILVFMLSVGAYSSAIYPVIASYFKVSLSSLRQLLELTNKLMVSLSLPLAVGGTIIAKPLMRLFYGTEYDNGVIALQIFFWVLVIMSLNVARGWGLLGCDKQKQYSLGTLAAVVVNISLNFILIPRIGLAGAALARLLSEVTACLFYHVELAKIVKISLFGHIFKPLLASLLTGSFVYWGLNNAGFNITALISSAAVIYTIIFYLIKGITLQEFRLIRNMVLAHNA